jgi:PRA1 family protein
MMSGFFKREHIRNITVYFGIGEERPFYVEKNPSLLIDRIRHNLSFFYLNYIMLTGALFCLTLLTSPTTIIGLAILAASWFWLIRSSQDGFLRVSSKYKYRHYQLLVLQFRN